MGYTVDLRRHQAALPLSSFQAVVPPDKCRIK